MAAGRVVPGALVGALLVYLVLVQMPAPEKFDRVAVGMSTEEVIEILEPNRFEVGPERVGVERWVGLRNHRMRVYLDAGTVAQIEIDSETPHGIVVDTLGHLWIYLWAGAFR